MVTEGKHKGSNAYSITMESVDRSIAIEFQAQVDKHVKEVKALPMIGDADVSAVRSPDSPHIFICAGGIPIRRIELVELGGSTYQVNVSDVC